jgi:hypothetical protein
MMKQAKAGEPILTADGKTVAAFWAVDRGMGAGHLHFIPRDHKDRFKLIGADATPVYDLIDQCTIWHHVAMPDGRSYWRISEGAPEGWWRDDPWFAPAPAKPGPENPHGMVAAIVQLLNQNRPDHQTAQWLDYIRGYYQSLADREDRRR